MPRSPKSPTPPSHPPRTGSPPAWWCAASKTPAYPDALFPVWRYHPFFTNTELPIEQADITHRQHAIIETVFADLIDGPLAHIPDVIFSSLVARPVYLLRCVVVSVADVAVNRVR